MFYGDERKGERGVRYGGFVRGGDLWSMFWMYVVHVVDECLCSANGRIERMTLWEGWMMLLVAFWDFLSNTSHTQCFVQS